MGAPVPFGQYVPGASPVHRVEARVKIGVTAAFTVALFAVETWQGLALAIAVVGSLVVLSGVPLRLVARGLRPIAWLMAFTVLANGLALSSDGAEWALGPVGVDGAGLARGVFFAVRVLVLVAGTSLVTLTTSPVELTDALSRLMRPFGKWRFPADDVAMMLTIALRFIPTTADEAERIIVAQVARGARFDQGGPLRRARAWVPVLVPLFVRLFRRADELAIAMESRCYTGSGRTHLRESELCAFDWLVLWGGVVAMTGLGVFL